MANRREKHPQEEVEEIEAMGQESETKAAKAVIELYDEEEKEERTKEAEKLEVLTSKRKLVKIFSYKEQLVIYLANLLREESFPLNYAFSLQITDKGIVLDIWKRDLTFRKRRAFAISGDAFYDYRACLAFACWAGNEVLEDYKIKERRTPGGIILPN